MGPARRDAAPPTARSPGRRSSSRAPAGTVPSAASLRSRLMSSIRTNAPIISPAPEGRFAPPPDAAALLAWYDRHRRDLPWRPTRGTPADPYRVWLSEIMLQQTPVVTAAPSFVRFAAGWPDIRAP